MKSPIYYAIFIDDISKLTLLNAFKYLIPENWKQYCDHLTISFGEPKTETVKNYITNFIGHKVSFYIDSFGKSDKAIAVKTSDNIVISENTNAHITLSVNKKCSPKDSNEILNWIDIDKIFVNGIVDQFPRIHI